MTLKEQNVKTNDRINMFIGKYDYTLEDEDYEQIGQMEAAC